MRNQESLFNAVAQFINEQPIGSTFSTQEYLNRVACYENITRWKQSNKSCTYRCHSYKGMLKKYFILNVKRGSWKVIAHIPDWFTTGHLFTLNWYATSSRYNNKTNTWTNTKRTKMTRDQILDKLCQGLQTQEIPKIDFEAAKEKMIADLNNKAEAARGALEIMLSTPKLKEVINESEFQPSGAFFLDNAIQGIPNTKINMISGTSQIQPKQIAQEESVFFKGETKTPAAAQDQLVQNLQVNIGLIESALLIMDKVQILDPLVQGRVVNIFHQLDALAQTVNERIHLNK